MYISPRMNSIFVILRKFFIAYNLLERPEFTWAGFAVVNAAVPHMKHASLHVAVNPKYFLVVDRGNFSPDERSPQRIGVQSVVAAAAAAAAVARQGI